MQGTAPSSIYVSFSVQLECIGTIPWQSCIHVLQCKSNWGHLSTRHTFATLFWDPRIWGIKKGIRPWLEKKLALPFANGNQLHVCLPIIYRDKNDTASLYDPPSTFRPHICSKSFVLYEVHQFWRLFYLHVILLAFNTSYISGKACCVTVWSDLQIWQIHYMFVPFFILFSLIDMVFI